MISLNVTPGFLSLETKEKNKQQPQGEAEKMF